VYPKILIIYYLAGVVAAVLQGDFHQAVPGVVGVRLHHGPVPRADPPPTHLNAALQGGQNCALRSRC
jgi:hypothetical protein